MKRNYFSILLSFLLVVCFLSSCKKEDKPNTTKEVIETTEYVFNTATKVLSPQVDVNVAIQSPTGVESIYSYLIRNNKADSLINVYIPSKNENIDASNFNLIIPTNSFAAANLTQVVGVKLMIKRIDNSANEEFVKIKAYTPFMPELVNFAQKLVAQNNKVIVTGIASSENGLQKLEIQDDAEVSFKTIYAIDNFSDKTYNLSYEYSVRANAKQIRVLLTDKEGYTIQKIINVETTVVTGPYKKYENLTLTSFGLTTANGLIAQSGTLLGSCDLPLRGIDSDILLYTTSTGAITIYASGNAGNIIKNFKCNDVEWALQAGQTLKATKLRVLDPTSSSQKRVIDAYQSNSITDLKTDGIFTGITAPSSNTSVYTVNGTGTNFDDLNRSLVWLQIPGASPTNCLIKIKKVVADGNNSSITFDLLVENK